MTKLMNINIDCPNEFFIFCNRYNWVTEHNLSVTKGFTSAAYSFCDNNNAFTKKYLEGSVNYLPFLPTTTDCGFLSPYCLTAINDYRIEYDAEICRKRNYPKFPSRLSAIFAFGDLETCHIVAKKYGWDLSSVKKFKLVEHPLTRVIKVNMEIVSLAKLSYKISYSNAEDLDRYWRHYWSGGGAIQEELPSQNYSRKTFDSGVIFEYLIEGSVKIIE